MSLLSESDEAHELYDTIVNAVMGGKASDMLLASSLYEIKEKNLYKKAVGRGVDTWEQFLMQPEVNLTQHRARKLITTYEYFVKEHGLTEADISDADMDNLWYVAKRDPDVSDDDLDLIVEAAKNLSHNHFKERYHDVFGEQERTYSYLVMQRCDQTNNLTKVHGINTEDVLNHFEINEQRPAKTKDKLREQGEE